MVSVPKAAAATACAPPAFTIFSTPASFAATKVAGSTEPSGIGGVKIIGCATPATTAGIAVINVTEGKLPLPRGEYSATVSSGKLLSPTSTPGLISILQSA